MVQRGSSEASSGDREVTLRIDGAVAYVLFDRPWARNAMTLAIYDGLATACAAINENSRVRVAVLRGARQGFCSPPTACAAGILFCASATQTA